jgi:alpha-beta hydrolase superfamily lysophospholipase
MKFARPGRTNIKDLQLVAKRGAGWTGALLLAALLALGAGPAGAEQAGGQLDQQKKTYDAHRPYVTYHFNDAEMDFGLEWVLGSTSMGGCEIGEAFYAAGRIKDGDPASWQEQWEALAGRVEAKGREFLAAGHRISAREALIRAANYYRTALVSMMPDDPRFKRLGQRLRADFKQAAELFDPPMVYFEVTCDGAKLPGYYRPVATDGKKRPTLIMIGGGETFAEELYTYIAPAAIKRGYKFLTVDLPGQGMLPLEGKFFRRDAEVPLAKVVDYALSRPEVDPARVAMYGISGGGYFVPRAASVDRRVKAAVLSSSVSDQYTLFKDMPNSKATPQEIAGWRPFKRATAGVVSWRWGLGTTDIHGLAEANRGWTVDPAQVECPVLILIGAGEYANQTVKKQQQDFLAKLPNPNKKLVVTPEDLGASSHCIGENRSLMREIVFNWLDETFKE